MGDVLGTKTLSKKKIKDNKPRGTNSMDLPGL